MAPRTLAGLPERNGRQADFLYALFRILDEHEVRYCVLHSWEGLPEVLPSDLDLAVHPRDLEKLVLVFRALQEKGYRPLQCLNYFVNAFYFVFWLDGPRPKTVALDVILEHRRSGLIVPSGEALVAGRRRENIFWIPSPAAEFAYLLAKKTWKGKVPGHQAQRLKLLVEQLGRAQAERLAGEIFLGKLKKRVVAACASGRADDLLGRIRRRPWWTSLARSPLKLMGHVLAEELRRTQRWFQPTGLFVVVLGPDGVGKSTVIEHVIKLVGPAFRRHRVFHWRPMLLWRRKSAGPVTNPHGQARHTPWWSVARLFLHLFDYSLGYALLIRPFLARSTLVVFDRYFHDLLVDPARYCYGGPQWIARAMGRLMPKPDLALVLDAPEEVILSRKQEVARQEVQRQRQSYLSLVNEFACARVIDGARPLPEVVRQAVGAVNEHLAQRFERRHARWLGLGHQAMQSQNSERAPGALP